MLLSFVTTANSVQKSQVIIFVYIHVYIRSKYKSIVPELGRFWHDAGSIGPVLASSAIIKKLSTIEPGRVLDG